MNKLGIVEEEVGESAFRSGLPVGCRKAQKEEINPYLEEANQLTRIVCASRITARRSFQKAGRE